MPEETEIQRATYAIVEAARRLVATRYDPVAFDALDAAVEAFDNLQPHGLND